MSESGFSRFKDFQDSFSEENHNLLNELIVMFDDEFNLVYSLILGAIFLSRVY